ncbi:hypothetical protein HF086_003592 [Spodoptera exigua]|uniref:CHK kinase-like domain-containing protein n=1 Tax=Spodoptera exigua TaxID=7107 RepID=A0A922SIL4_SPOEX|nr:hypothetical protein HF086_003592 [Spodoptera exigua]
MADAQKSLREFLNKIAREHKYVDPEITIEEISSGGANYTSKLFTAVVREAGKEDLHLFAKVAVFSESMRNVVPNVFLLEQYTYTELAKWFETMERDCGVPEKDRLVFCKFYGLEPTLNREILVLENLLPQGYGPHDRFQSVDWPYAASAVRELAKMHALSFAFATKYPKEFDNAMKNITLDWPAEILDHMIRQAVPTAVKVINPENKEAFVKFMDEAMKTTYFDILKPVNSKVAIIHRDYRGNNLLHRRREPTMADVEPFLREYLNKIAREHKYVDPEITIEEISSGGANYTSKLFTAVVREASKEDLHLFAKLAVIGESMRKDFPEIYETENYAYTKVAKLYESLERESDVPEENRLVFCKFYGFDPSPNREILVLENLLPQGYGPHDRFHSVDWPYAAAAIRELAKMHALSFAFAKRYPGEFEKIFLTLKGIWQTLPFDELAANRIESAVKIRNE